MILQTYRITVVLKVKTDIIASITVSPIERAVILVIMDVEIFKTSFIVFISEVKMCSNITVWPIIFNISQFLHMRVTNGPYIFVDQGQFSDLDFISRIYQRENVQFADKNKDVSFEGLYKYHHWLISQLNQSDSLWY
jgi:hypothetical protein